MMSQTQGMVQETTTVFVAAHGKTQDCCKRARSAGRSSSIFQ